MSIRRDAYSRNLFPSVVFVLIISVALMNWNMSNTYRLPLLTVASIIGVHSVYATFTLLASSIVIPDFGLPFTATQFVLLVWIFGWLVWQRDHRFYISYNAVFLLSPFVLWVAISAAVTYDFTLVLQILKVIAVVFVTYHVLSLDRIRPELILLSIFLGTCLSTVPLYLGAFLNIPGFEVSHVGEHSLYYSQIGILRYSITKQDPNAVSLLLSLTFWGMLNLGMRARMLDLPVSRKWLVIIASLCIPPMVMAQSRGSFVVFVVTATLTILLGLFERFNVSKSIKITSFPFPKTNVQLSTILVVIPVFMISLVIIGHVLDMKWSTIINSVMDILAYRGLDDRSLRFSEAWNHIASAPLFGVGTVIYLETTASAPHNIFLDVGIAAGLPGMAFFLSVVLMPVLLYVFNPKLIAKDISIAIITYLTCLGFMLSLSIIGDKIFWCLWAFLIYMLRKQS
jgi:hypothetical protein